MLLKHTNYALLEIPNFDALAPDALLGMFLVETTSFLNKDTQHGFKFLTTFMLLAQDRKSNWLVETSEFALLEVKKSQFGWFNTGIFVGLPPIC